MIPFQVLGSIVLSMTFLRFPELGGFVALAYLIIICRRLGM